HLNLPAIAVQNEKIAIGHSPDKQTLRFYRRKAGDLLHDIREGRNELDRLKQELGSQRFSAQYQQDPLPLDGNLIRPHWIPRYTPEELSRISAGANGQIVQSWDIATTTTANSDWSVCTTWLKVRKDYYLLHVLRIKKEFPALKKLINTHCLKWNAKSVLIEKDGIGLSLYQALMDDRTTGVPYPIGIKVKGDKFVRMEAQSATIEAGHMHIPEDAPWMADYLKELLGFPHAKHDDQVDSTSQFLNWAATSKRASIISGAIIINADDDYGCGVDPGYPSTLDFNNGF
ncbi:MAG: phage terminase large subunit, partial [Litorimonas sp.]